MILWDFSVNKVRSRISDVDQNLSNFELSARVIDFDLDFVNPNIRELHAKDCYSMPFWGGLCDEIWRCNQVHRGIILPRGHIYRMPFMIINEVCHHDICRGVKGY